MNLVSDHTYMYYMYTVMAETCAPLPAGGYECDFVDAIPESLSCPVCLLPFRDPHLVSCCGAKYCEPCIGRVKAAGQPCPLCKQQFVSLLDRSLQRKVLELKIRCSRKKDGCEWEGELRHLSNHEREECVWALVECGYHCGERLPRRQLAEHEQDVCPQRPVDIKLESFMRKMDERHMREMATVREDHMREMATVKEYHTREMATVREDHMREMATVREDHTRGMATVREDHTREMATVREEMTAMREEFEKMKQVANELKKETESYRSELETMKQQTKGLVEKKLAEQKVRFSLNLAGRLSMLISVPHMLCLFFRINTLESWRSQLLR